ncbi:MAG: hypothetical protein F6K23_07770 [Okeania sp. SIO2C9]|uniref:hypothetical protein n=1 Tax=Okeania sp. SIO2C9 TaxID=2607791 RepID=UPI0013BF1EF9|nr:hypothetical protein [Okeania sp. SIO2C9]NEQ72979.1 hypothetical protein [Okeania sp. SIO2C9]
MAYITRKKEEGRRLNIKSGSIGVIRFIVWGGWGVWGGRETQRWGDEEMGR